MQWSSHQKSLVDLGDNQHKWQLIWGPVRSGKSVAALAGYLAWAGENFSGHTFILAAHTYGQMVNVVLPTVYAIAKEAGVSTFRRERTHLLKVGSNDFLTYDAHTKASRDKIQGMTLSGAYLDDAALMPEGFISQIATRCSEPGAKIVITANPEGPGHFLKKQYIDRASVIGADCHQLSMDDNPSLDPAYVADLERTLTGPFLRRARYGEWAAAAGLIFGNFRLEAPPAEAPYAYELAIDAATSSVTHALLIARYKEATWIVAEYRYDGRETGQLSDVDQVDGIIAMTMGAPITHAVIDPHALNTKAELKRRLTCAVESADNAVHPGILYTQAALAHGAVRISPACPELERECGAYLWDPDKAAAGEDAPIKKDDHGCDAMRYWCYTRHAHHTRVAQTTFGLEVMDPTRPEAM